jgi:hypothetical protein
VVVGEVRSATLARISRGAKGGITGGQRKKIREKPGLKAAEVAGRWCNKFNSVEGRRATREGVGFIDGRTALGAKGGKKLHQDVQAGWRRSHRLGGRRPQVEQRLHLSCASRANGIACGQPPAWEDQTLTVGFSLIWLSSRRWLEIGAAGFESASQ